MRKIIYKSRLILTSMLIIQSSRKVKIEPDPDNATSSEIMADGYTNYQSVTFTPVFSTTLHSIFRLHFNSTKSAVITSIRECLIGSSFPICSLIFREILAAALSTRMLQFRKSLQLEMLKEDECRLNSIETVGLRLTHIKEVKDSKLTKWLAKQRFNQNT